MLEIEPPSNTGDPDSARMRAQIEVYWLNPITYRTVIRSPEFSQIRIVNGRVVEEPNTGDFYPRWIENFVDAILEPIPKAELLRKVPGSVPVGLRDHACISGDTAEVCFQDAEPLIATGSDTSRSFWFDNFEPFGQQRIARTLVNQLPGGLLERGRIVSLSPLNQSDYSLLKAQEFTLPDKLIETQFVSRASAESLFPMPRSGAEDRATRGATGRNKAHPSPTAAIARPAVPEVPATVFIRTDRNGRVREAYSESSRAQDGSAARALALRFKPLVVDGAPRQMDASIAVP